LVFGFGGPPPGGAPTIPTSQTGSVDPTLITTIDPALPALIAAMLNDPRYIIQPTLAAFALYEPHADRIAITLANCDWKAGASVSLTELTHIILVLSDIYIYKDNGSIAKFIEVIYFTLQNTYPDEDAEYLLVISRMLAFTAENTCTTEVVSGADGYDALVDYL
jgi:hypothetical protein